ncbi:hypothetical protein MKI84_00010 [Ancylobacter sp. A5.8]|uniref:hypothetical protein n=1 Tax=Ancylobacter gelatini TaxID=2919920 RepID=UPI001F4ED32F|nr:hypothetical protein [Ancylobacter gelatini]MCJ8141298.1 hypothetical protein [Ancylobacter gelatini]
MLCAHCLRCGRRSVVGRSSNALLAESEDGKPRLRCDMCGGRNVKLFQAQGPVEMLAFLSGRL